MFGTYAETKGTTVKLIMIAGHTNDDSFCVDKKEEKKTE